MEAERSLLPEHGTAPWRALIGRLAGGLRQGRLALLPAEGVYGLHGSGPAGHLRLREVKGQRAERPFIILISSPADLPRYAAELSGEGRDLLDRAWPGALTLVLPARAGLPSIYTRSGAVALRCPGEALLRELAAALSEPLLSTSANRSTDPAPRTYDEIDSGVRAQCWLGIDDGPRGGIGSTVARFDGAGRLTILRPGLWKPDHSS